MLELCSKYMTDGPTCRPCPGPLHQGAQGLQARTCRASSPVRTKRVLTRVQAKDAHVGAVKAYSLPPKPQAPALPADLASELAAPCPESRLPLDIPLCLAGFQTHPACARPAHNVNQRHRLVALLCQSETSADACACTLIIRRGLSNYLQRVRYTSRGSWSCWSRCISYLRVWCGRFPL